MKKPLSSFKPGDKVYICDGTSCYEKDKVYTIKEDYNNKIPNGGYPPGEWFTLEECRYGANHTFMTLVEKAPKIKETESKSSWGF